MPDTTPAAEKAPVAAIVAIVAPTERLRPIAELLGESGLPWEGLENVDALCESDQAEEPAAVVLWVQDAVGSLGRTIEPLRRRLRSAPIVAVCPNIQRWEVRAALSAGAAGVVLEQDMGQALVPCLQAVQAGQACVPRENWRQIEPPALSTREKQILGLVVMGYMNSEIAERLFLAESTVKSHLSSAFGKLGVRSRNEAVSLIVDPERGLGMGILGLGGEPVESIPTNV